MLLLNWLRILQCHSPELGTLQQIADYRGAFRQAAKKLGAE